MYKMKLSKIIFPVILDIISGEPFHLSFFDAPQTGYVWDEALNVMSFHRDKMNEYLCKNYVASEIIETIRNKTANNVQEKRENIENVKISRLARESLLADPGSQNYKDWLSRSSTLEDIYRQFEHAEHDEGTHHEVSDGHEGEVTGYAVVGHKHVYSKPPEYIEEVHPHTYYKEEEEEEEHDEKGLKLKELFHFALTAIAFLAFACFMIEVIMCLVEVPQTTEPDYVLVPTSTGGTGHAGKVETEIPNSNREERTLNFDLIPIETLNDMSSKVLSSIEALALIHEDDGQCLQRALCQNSKYSKTLPGTQKLWLPLWSFGMSWIGNRFSKNKNDSLYTLKYLKAAVLGLGSRECHKIYPKCDDRRRRRKLRNNQ